jgi:transcriptional regulator with XRE-family HTH domain
MTWNAEAWKRLGDHIAGGRKALGMDQRQLAAAADVSENTISNYERGRVPSKGLVPTGYGRIERALGWADGSIRTVLDGGSPIVTSEQRSTGDSLARRMADNQIRMATDDLIRDSDRLADDARRYADSLKSDGVADSGTASRLAQDAADLARRASRLDGMCDIAGLIPDIAT